jgi:hypothetical protein
MHLEGPWLSTTGKKKGPKKWASAEAKRKAEFLEESWKALQKTWGVEAEEKKRKRALAADTYQPKETVYHRETPKIESRDTGWVPCVKVQDQVYTGDKIKGIGTMHKSNAVPVFSDQEAIEISTMRR